MNTIILCILVFLISSCFPSLPSPPYSFFPAPPCLLGGLCCCWVPFCFFLSASLTEVIITFVCENLLTRFAISPLPAYVLLILLRIPPHRRCWEKDLGFLRGNAPHFQPFAYSPNIRTTVELVSTMAESSALPPSIYHSLSRPDREKALNTIIEDTRESSFEENQEGPPGEGSVTGTAMIVKFKKAWSHANGTGGQHGPPSPTARRSSPTRTSLLRWRPQSSHPNYDDLYDATDDEEDGCSEHCPSLSSRHTSFSSGASRDSGGSVSSRNKYPPLTIPPSSVWPMPHKSSPVPPTPPPKIPVSPAALSLLPRTVPALHAPPSLDGSVTSDQLSNSSAPSTPGGSQKHPEGHWENDRLHFRGSELTQGTEISSEPTSPNIEIRVQSPGYWNQEPGDLSQDTVDIHSDRPPENPGPDQDAEQERSQTPSSDNGVALPEDALATLQHIAYHQGPEQLSVTTETDGEMSEVAFPHERPKSAQSMTTPASAISAYSFSELSIPSPGGFFSSLEPGSRRTWCPIGTANPPSSATAENFYNCPWNKPAGSPHEHIVAQGDNTSSEGPPTVTSLSDGPSTAIRIPSRSPTATPPHDTMSVEGSSSKEASLTEIVHEYDDSYESELKKQALANLDRTSVWLATQSSYLAALRETNPVNEVNSQDNNPPKVQESRPGSSSKSRLGSLPTIPEGERDDQSPKQSPVVKDSTFYRGFQHAVSRSRRRDSFLHSADRFEAIRASRQCLMEKHLHQLTGKYELHPPKRPAYVGPFCQAPRNSVECKVLADQAKFARAEKEQNALRQLRPSMWAIDALKYLNGGRLIPSPGAKRLAGATSPLGSPESAGKRRVRVLDLGGNPSCDWAWHIAVDYRNVKIYTVVTKDQVVNPEVKGPPNHRPVSVPHLWKLPFRDNQFDVISARSLHMLLKSEFPPGEGKDEYDLCLRECYRCLKPGGYLEFFLLDSELAHAGPCGSAASVEFGFNLKTRGYDPAPTKCFLSRLRKAQFVGMKRAWMFLPMGSVRAEQQIPRETPVPPDLSGPQPSELEAVRGPIGSTSDIANLTGLFGGWMWEQWLLKFQMEMGRDRERLLEGVSAVFDEGCQTGAGWRCLNGWAMKPRRPKKPTGQDGFDGTDIPSAPG